MPDESQAVPAGQDRFRLKAAEFRTLAEKARDPVIADAYRRLAEGYESLTKPAKASPQRDKR